MEDLVAKTGHQNCTKRVNMIGWLFLSNSLRNHLVIFGFMKRCLSRILIFKFFLGVLDAITKTT